MRQNKLRIKFKNNSLLLFLPLFTCDFSDTKRRINVFSTEDMKRNHKINLKHNGFLLYVFVCHTHCTYADTSLVLKLPFLYNFCIVVLFKLRTGYKILLLNDFISFLSEYYAALIFREVMQQREKTKIISTIIARYKIIVNLFIIQYCLKNKVLFSAFCILRLLYVVVKNNDTCFNILLRKITFILIFIL